MESDGAEPESNGSGELRAAGLNSPWGIIWSIIKDTGWSYQYVLHGVSWINIQIMMADGPRVERGKKDNHQRIDNDAELGTWLEKIM